MVLTSIMNDQPCKISVIVPVFNGARYLARTLDSIVGQTVTDWECLIVNDGSTDGSDALAREYARRDGRIQLIDAPHGGVSRARNLGLSRAAGQYIHFMDGDDGLVNDAYQTFLDRFREHPEADVVHGLYDTVDDEDRVIIPTSERVEADDYLSLLLVRNPLPIQFLLIRKAALEGLEFDAQLKVAEDGDFLIRMALKGLRFRPVHRMVGHYRRHAGSAMGDMDEIVRGLERVVRRYHVERRGQLPARCRRLRTTAEIFMWMRICWRAELNQRPDIRAWALRRFSLGMLRLAVTRVNLWYFQQYRQFARARDVWPARVACLANPVFPVWGVWTLRNVLVRRLGQLRGRLVCYFGTGHPDMHVL
jgi:glycosyltransferase involved in cell wall biosynthesis